MCGCTRRIIITWIRGRTPRATCGGGPTASASGALGREVFAYFDNDGHGLAVRNSLALRALPGE
jgi:hypothetical protein